MKAEDGMPLQKGFFHSACREMLLEGGQHMHARFIQAQKLAVCLVVWAMCNALKKELFMNFFPAIPMTAAAHVWYRAAPCVVKEHSLSVVI